MVEAREVRSAMSRRLLLARASELQAASSWATRAASGLTLRLLGQWDSDVRDMIKEGIRFCDFFLRDVEAYDGGQRYRYAGGGPRYYDPAEVVGTPLDVKEAKAKVEGLRTALNTVVCEEKPRMLDRELDRELTEYRSLIVRLAKPYQEQATDSLGECKYGPSPTT